MRVESTAATLLIQVDAMDVVVLGTQRASDLPGVVGGCVVGDDH